MTIAVAVPQQNLEKAPPTAVPESRASARRVGCVLAERALVDQRAEGLRRPRTLTAAIGSTLLRSPGSNSPAQYSLNGSTRSA